MNDLMERDENEELYELSITMMRRIMQIFGAWPILSKSYNRHLRILLYLIANVTLIFFLIPFALNMIVIVKKFTTRVRLLGPMSHCLMAIHKMVVLFSNDSQLLSYFNWMAADYRALRHEFERTIMQDGIKLARLFISLCIVSMYGSGAGYSLIFAIATEPIVIDNVTYHQLAYPMYFHFFDAAVRPAFDVMYSFQFFYAMISFSLGCASCSVAIVLTMHICSQISITSSMFEKLDTKEFNQRTLKDIIQRHLRTLEFAKKVKSLFKNVFFVDMIGCGLNMCLLGYYFITEYQGMAIGPFTYCFLWASFMIQIYILCYIGDKLLVTSNNLSYAAYSINWYLLSKDKAKDLLLIIASTQQPITLTAGKMFTLSIPCFSLVLKSSFTYLNMLRTVTVKQT